MPPRGRCDDPAAPIFPSADGHAGGRFVSSPRIARRDGKPRALLVEQALESIDFDRGPVEPIAPVTEPIAAGGSRERLSRSSYFALERLNLEQPEPAGRPDRFTILMALAGSFDVRHGADHTRVDFGQTLLLPAGLGHCQISPRGRATVLTCIVP